MHNISDPVNGCKLRDWKHYFPQKSVGGCTSYDIIALWPDLTRPIFLCQTLRKGCPIGYAKFQRDPPSGSEAISEKLIEEVASLPTLHGRGLRGGDASRANFGMVILFSFRDDNGSSAETDWTAVYFRWDKVETANVAKQPPCENYMTTISKNTWFGTALELRLFSCLNVDLHTCFKQFRLYFAIRRAWSNQNLLMPPLDEPFAATAGFLFNVINNVQHQSLIY